jgi:hypothetical protein
MINYEPLLRSVYPRENVQREKSGGFKNVSLFPI